MQTALKAMPLLIMLLWVPAHVVAQEAANSQPDAVKTLQAQIQGMQQRMGAMQTQNQEMQKRMAARQTELDALHGTADLSHEVTDLITQMSAVQIHPPQ